MLVLLCDAAGNAEVPQLTRNRSHVTLPHHPKGERI
jgi:hypothetical protein